MSASLNRYWMTFAAIYGGAMLLVNVLVHGFDLDLGSGANLAMLFAAGYGTAIKFVTDNKRAPDAAEKRKLALGSLAIAWLLSIFAVVLMVIGLGEDVSRELFEVLQKVPAVVWILIVSVITLLYYLLLNLMYGWGARRYAAKALARGAI
jgi:hypothetical protein